MTPIYHITHVDNLPGIIQAGRLWSDTQRIRQGFACTNIGYKHIKDRRMRRPVPVSAGGVLGDYVPFNFCSRSVMLYVISRGHEDYNGGQSPIVHLVSSVEAAVDTGWPWAFTDRHAELGYAKYYDDLKDLDKVDWTAMPMQYWGGDDERKERRQAEFLVHDWFPWTAFDTIAVHDDTIVHRVRQALRGIDHQPVVRVESAWYYR